MAPPELVDTAETSVAQPPGVADPELPFHERSTPRRSPLIRPAPFRPSASSSQRSSLSSTTSTLATLSVSSTASFQDHPPPQHRGASDGCGRSRARRDYADR